MRIGVGKSGPARSFQYSITEVGSEEVQAWTINNIGRARMPINVDVQSSNPAKLGW